MKNKDLVQLYRALNKVGKLTGARFSYAVTKNLNALKAVMETFEKASEMKPEYAKYDQARMELAKKWADKDEKGNPKFEVNPDDTTTTQYVMSAENEAEFNKEWEKLKEEYKDAILARGNQAKEYEEMMELENPMVDIHKIKLEDCPAGISVEQMYSLQSIIEE